MKAVLKIDELTVQLGGKSWKIEDLTAADFLVSVDYTVTPGHPGKFDGPAEDCYPEVDDEINLSSVQLVCAATFASEGMKLDVEMGYDIKEFFSNQQLAALEDRIFKGEGRQDE